MTELADFELAHVPSGTTDFANATPTDGGGSLESGLLPEKSPLMGWGGVKNPGLRLFA